MIIQQLPRRDQFYKLLIVLTVVSLFIIGSIHNRQFIFAFVYSSRPVRTTSNSQSTVIDDVSPVGEIVSDELFSDGIVTGAIKLSSNTSYAVFSTTVDNNPESLNFLFLLPLTVLAWKRIGFGSIVVFVGHANIWHEDKTVRFVVSQVRKLDAITIFLEPRPENSIMISQVSRLFVANILRSQAALKNSVNDVYVVTSDADIWPIDGAAYRLPPGKDIISLNAKCCGSFRHNGTTFQMLPMSNIGMKIGTWHSVTNRFGYSPQSVDDMLSFLHREFGSVVYERVVKGENVGWYIDQRTVSILIADWIRLPTIGRNESTSRSNRVEFRPRSVSSDRIDRSRWSIPSASNIAGKIDAHLPEHGYRLKVWATVLPLIDALYGGPDSEAAKWSRQYHNDSLQMVSRINLA